MSTHNITMLATVQSPLTHMRGVEGNEALISVERIDTPTGQRDIPRVNGNAARHRMIREPGGLWLVEALELKGKLSLEQLNFLLHGGNLTQSTSREDTRRIAEMQELFPLLRLMGGALPDQILRGSLLAKPWLLFCRENEPRLRNALPDGYALPDRSLKPSADYISGYQNTRGDARRRTDWYDEATHNPDEKSNLMIYSGQCVIPGAVFLTGFDIPHGSELELGCLLHSLQLWAEHGSTIGGMASKGHGRLSLQVLGFGGDISALSQAYVGHVNKHKQECRDWLAKVFATKADKDAAKPKKGKKGAADGEAE